jgi:hypothetical protein
MENETIDGLNTKTIAINMRRIAPEIPASKIEAAIEDAGINTSYKYVRQEVNDKVSESYSINEISEEINRDLWPILTQHLKNVGVEEDDIYSQDNLIPLKQQQTKWKEEREKERKQDSQGKSKNGKESSEPNKKTKLIALYELYNDLSVEVAANKADCSIQYADDIKTQFQDDEFSEDKISEAKNAKIYKIEGKIKKGGQNEWLDLISNSLENFAERVMKYKQIAADKQEIYDGRDEDVASGEKQLASALESLVDEAREEIRDNTSNTDPFDTILEEMKACEQAAMFYENHSDGRDRDIAKGRRQAAERFISWAETERP